MNKKQLKHITKKLHIKGRDDAIWDVINGGLTAYASEQKHGITPNSLLKSVRSVKNDEEYINKFIQWGEE